MYPYYAVVATIKHNSYDCETHVNFLRGFGGKIELSSVNGRLPLDIATDLIDRVNRLPQFPGVDKIQLGECSIRFLVASDNDIILVKPSQLTPQALFTDNDEFLPEFRDGPDSGVMKMED